MEKVGYYLIWVIIILLIYFLGGWIIKDIVFSMIDITPETTIEQIYIYELRVYSIICGIFTFICSAMTKKEGIIPFWLVFGMYFLTTFLPISIGLTILYNVVNIGAMIWSIAETKY